MSKTFKVSIVTAEQTLLETELVSLIVPGIAGYLGILANHAPLVTALVPGVMKLRHDDSGTADSVSVFAVSNGFIEVADNAVSVMVDSCETAAGIDVSRAEKALARAKERLAERGDHGKTIDAARAEAALARAKARLMAAGKGR